MVTKRARLWLARGLAVSIALVLVVLGAATWWYSGEIERRVFTFDDPLAVRDVVVLARDDDEVVLPADERTTQPGIWGLAFDGGYLEVGEPGPVQSGVVARPILASIGAPGSGERGSWDRMAFTSPDSRGIDAVDVLIDGSAGPLPAWSTPGANSTWAIFVHGAGSDRREALRLLPVATGLGMPTLTISYRNDPDGPDVGSGRHGYGRSEWADLEDAVEFALAGGARRVVLVGYGTGGSVVTVFLRLSELAGRVSGVVLDAPILDPRLLVDRMSSEEKVPGFLVAWSRAVASFRFGVEWSVLDHLDAASDLSVPMMIVTGAEDTEASASTAAAFVDAYGGAATLLVVPGAGYGESWNLDSDAYEQAVGAFLESLLNGDGAAG